MATKKPTKKTAPATKDEVFRKVQLLRDYADTLEDNGCEDAAGNLRRDLDEISQDLTTL